MILLHFLGAGSAVAADLDRKINFNIPERPLAQALADFARQSDVIIVAPSKLTDGKVSKPVTANTTAAEALNQLLTGTGLTYTQDKDGSVLVRESPPNTIQTKDPAEKTPAATPNITSPPGPEPRGNAENSTGVAQAQEHPYIQEVLVSARKRGDEALQDIPATITVVGADALQKMGVSSFADFAYQVPGLTFTDNGPGQKRYTIRGIQSAGQEQVAVYYDEVPMSGIQSETSDSGSQTPDLKIYDMARIEVLKGPQGTTFGANSQTGAVRFITNKPDLNTLEASFRGNLSQTSGGSISPHGDGGNNWGAFGMVNVPIIADRLAIRLVAYDSRDGGYIDNVRLNIPDVNWVDTKGVRGLLRWTPAETVSLDFMAWAQKQDSGGSSAYMPFDTIFDDYLTREQKVGLSADQGGRDNISALARFQPGTFNSGSYVQTPIPDTQNIYSLTANWQLPWANLTATGSRYERQLSLLQDSSFMLFSLGVRPDTSTAPGVRPDLFPAVTDQTQSLAQNAVEIRLNSTLNGPLQYLVGGFWRDRKSRFRSYISVVDPQTGLRFNPGVAPGAIVAPNVGAGIDGCLPCVFARTNNRDVKEDAAFGELTYDPIPALEATAGLRWFRVAQSDLGRTVFPFALFAFTPQLPDVRHFNEDKIIKKFGLSYRLSSAALLYALASQGFRLGGTNQQGLVAVPPFYASDSVWNYEAGLKSTWLNRRITLNTAAFRMIWNNLQVAGRDPTGAFGFIGNAGAAAITGLEAEVFAKSGERWDITLGASWLPQRELTADQVSAEIIAPGKKGDKIPRIPGLTANATAQYTMPLPVAGWSGWLRSEWSYKSGSSTEFRPFELLGGNKVSSPNQRYQRGFHITNFRAGAHSDVLEAEFTFFVDNVFNVHGDADIFVSGGQPTRKITNLPRTIGLQIDKHF